MINSLIRRRNIAINKSISYDITRNLLESRNLFNTQTIQYDIITVTSMDIDERGTFLLVGLSNGGVDLMDIEDPSIGTVSTATRMNFSQFNLNRVQWSPTGEQFFSILDNHDLQLIDPVDMRTIDKYEFDIKTNWSEWNPFDQKLIAVCGSGSQIRLVDIQSGSSVQTVILGAPSRLASHRVTRCLWSPLDSCCLIAGDNEGYLHIYDIRHVTRPMLVAGEERGQISGMSFTKDKCSIITSQGTENNLVQWNYDKCKLRSDPQKFQKRKPTVNHEETVADPGINGRSSKHHHSKETKDGNVRKRLKLPTTKRRAAPIPMDAYIRCQFYVTDRHILCPVPASTMKSKEINIYDLKSGQVTKTLKSDGIFNQGVYSVTSLLPDSVVIYIGGRGRLRVWTIDEDHQRKLEERSRQYHLNRWDSDE